VGWFLYDNRNAPCYDALALIVVNEPRNKPFFIVNVPDLPIPRGVGFTHQLRDLRGYAA